jgi:soluble P-type ATPase
MKTRSPFDNEGKRLELLQRLNEISGISFPSDAINRRPSLGLSTLEDEAVLKKFLNTFDWVIQEIKSAINL